MTEPVDLSVIIPVYNEEPNLPILLEELTKVLATVNQTYEVICINDASTDNSGAVLSDLQTSYAELKVFTHRLNCGESAGQATGFRNAQGDILITMDADLQNDPADIPSFLKNLTDGVDCVCGIRKIREDDFVKRTSSRIANKFRDLIIGDAIQDAGCTYRMIRRRAIAEILVFNGMHRFLPAILKAQGFCVVEIEVNHRPRLKGISKYGVGNRLWRGIRDCFAMRWYQARALTGLRIENQE